VFQAVDQLRLVEGAQNHVHAGELPADCLNHGWEIISKNDRRRANADPGCTQKLFPNLRKFPEKRFDEFEKFFAGWRQLERTPFIQGDPQIPFQGVDLRTNGGLLDPVGHVPRRSRNSFELRNVIEEFQLVRIHIDPFYEAPIFIN
jgi:hypothetical protein